MTTLLYAGSRIECYACDGQGLIPDDTGMLVETCGLCEGCSRIKLIWVPDKEWDGPLPLRPTPEEET